MNQIELIIWLACPTTCATCTSDTVCQSCQSGYGLQSNNCATCPSGTYLNGQTCTACPTTCDICSSDTVCQNCKSGYGLQNNLCDTCPAGTYLTGQNCNSKKLLFEEENEFIFKKHVQVIVPHARAIVFVRLARQDTASRVTCVRHALLELT